MPVPHQAQCVEPPENTCAYQFTCIGTYNRFLARSNKLCKLAPRIYTGSQRKSRIMANVSLPSIQTQPRTTVGLQTSSITSYRDVCEVERNWYTLGFQAIVLPSIFFNAATLIAALIDRKKLQRENCFFASVISTIVSNNVYLFMLEWILFDNYWDPATAPKAAGLTFDKVSNQ